MAWLSNNEMWEAFGTRALFWAGTGSDFGEVKTTIERIGAGDIHDWHHEWTATAERIESIGDECVRRKHSVSAREAYIRAATYHRTAYYPLFGPKVESPLAESSRREWNAMVKAAPLFDPPIEILEIPYGDATLPALLMRAGTGNEPCPLIVHTNGYDSTVCEMLLGNALAGVARGYHCLLFDGPAQGRALIEQRLPMRPDWEKVVTPVVDVAVKLPGVDPEKIILVGWSFGGFLVTRAAAFEPRAAAVIADPGQWDQRDNVISALPLSDEQKADFPNINPRCLDPMVEWLTGPSGDPMLRWKLLQRGPLVHAVDNLFDYLKELLAFELSAVVGNITCPILVTMADGDPSATGAPKVIDAVASKKKQLVYFTDAEGSGGHCEGTARMLYHQRTFDWLDEVLA